MKPIYHCNANVISRSAGKSAVASAAYRARAKLYDERYGKTHDYRYRGGLSYDAIMRPIDSPEYLGNRLKLWNEIEKVETHKNAQVARDFTLALPQMLSKEQNIKLVRAYVQEQFVDRGMIADICIHDLDKHNPHAHVMLTMRRVNKDGFFKEKKSARVWNDIEVLKEQRERWSYHTNQALERAGFDERVDHRSWKDKGIDRTPEIHLGWYASSLEKQGIKSDKGNQNRLIRQINRIKELNREIQSDKRKLSQNKRTAIREKIAETTAKILASQELLNQEKQLIQQVLEQQDRERGKSRSMDSKNPERDGKPKESLDQKVENLKSAMDEFDLNKEKQKQQEIQRKNGRKRRER